MKKDIIPLKGNVMMNFTLYGVRAHVTVATEGWSRTPSELTGMILLMHRFN